MTGRRWSEKERREADVWQRDEPQRIEGMEAESMAEREGATLRRENKREAERVTERGSGKGMKEMRGKNCGRERSGKKERKERGEVCGEEERQRGEKKRGERQIVW